MRRAAWIAGAVFCTLPCAGTACAKQAQDPPRESPLPAKDGSQDGDGKKDGSNGDGTAPPSTRKDLPELQKEWEAAKNALLMAMTQRDNREAEKRRAEAEVEPARERLRRLADRPNEDQDKKEAQRALHELVEKKRIVELDASLTRAEIEKAAAIKKTVRAGRAYRTRIFELVEIMDGSRLKEAEGKLEDSFQVMKYLDAFESLPPPHVGDFVRPLISDEDNPKWIETQRALYVEDAQNSEELVRDQNERVEQCDGERRHLVHLKDNDVMLSRVNQRLGEVEARLEEAKKVRDTAAKRAKDLRDEIDRLGKRLEELKGPEASKKDSK